MSAKDCDVVLQRLMGLHPNKLIDLSLARVVKLLDKMGSPEKRLSPVVHVAGTNGKGSVIALLRSVLEAAGYRVHVYTSPHLVRFNERIRLAGELISDADLLALLEDCENVNAGEPITFFEITTVAAFVAFNRAPADIVLLETGLGGRLDATNVVDQPALTAITPISMDHQDFLGDSLDKIALEKAGIMKFGVPSVVGVQDQIAMAVLEEQAAKVGAPIIQAAPTLPDPWPDPILPGSHQRANAAQVLACLESLEGFRVDDAAILAGFQRANWPARLQNLTYGPLVDGLPDGWQLWLDGGHNPAAGGIISEHAQAHWADRPLHVICGMLNTKDPRGFLRPLVDQIASFTAIPIPGEPNSLSGPELSAVAGDLGMDAQMSETVALAAANIIQMKGPARVLICGSLYLAGTVLMDNG